ncbi:hypothetical protein P7K49_001894, partial [Saguinus oedipus]
RQAHGTELQAGPDQSHVIVQKSSELTGQSCGLGLINPMSSYGEAASSQAGAVGWACSIPCHRTEER